VIALRTGGRHGDRDDETFDKTAAPGLLPEVG
jgi:hypothetical protein